MRTYHGMISPNFGHQVAFRRASVTNGAKMGRSCLSLGIYPWKYSKSSMSTTAVRIKLKVSMQAAVWISSQGEVERRIFLRCEWWWGHIRRLQGRSTECQVKCEIKRCLVETKEFVVMADLNGRPGNRYPWGSVCVCVCAWTMVMSWWP